VSEQKKTMMKLLVVVVVVAAAAQRDARPSLLEDRGAEDEEERHIFSRAENFDIQQYFREHHGAEVPQCEQWTQTQYPRGSVGGTCVYVDPNGRVVHARDLHNEAGSGKQMLMDMMLRGVVDEIRRSGRWRETWVSFLMVYAASGPVRNEKFPVLGFGKRDPDRPGLLVPNPFFVTPKWWDDVEEAARDLSAQRPWRSRSSKVLFRGACGPGAHARLELLRLPDPEDRLDVGFTKVDGFASMYECVKDLAAPRNVNASSRDVDLVMRHRLKAMIPQANYSKYRYLLHMPGSATGSYSRNLQYLWAHGAIVLIWKHAAREWYYQHLRDRVHYLSVDASNLYDVLRELDADPQLQLKLRRGGQQFAFKFLSGRTLVDRWHAILAVLQDRQVREPTIPRDACTCDPRLLNDTRVVVKACQKCEITAKKGRTISKFVGLVPKAAKASLGGASSS